MHVNRASVHSTQAARWLLATGPRSGGGRTRICDLWVMSEIRTIPAVPHCPDRCTWRHGARPERLTLAQLTQLVHDGSLLHILLRPDDDADVEVTVLFGTVTATTQTGRHFASLRNYGILAARCYTQGRQRSGEISL